MSVSQQEVGWSRLNLTGSAGLSWANLGVCSWLGISWSRLGSFGDSSAPCVSHPSPGTCGLAWVCPSEGNGSSIQEQTQLCKPFSGVCLSLICYHPIGQITELSSEWRGGGVPPTHHKKGMQSHMAKGEVANWGHWYNLPLCSKTKHSLTSDSLHLLFLLPGTSSL